MPIRYKLLVNVTAFLAVALPLSLGSLAHRADAHDWTHPRQDVIFSLESYR